MSSMYPVLFLEDQKYGKAIQPANGSQFTPDEIDALIDGLHEVAARSDEESLLMLADRNAGFKDRPVNQAASRIAKQCIKGHVLIVTRGQYYEAISD